MSQLCRLFGDVDSDFGIHHFRARDVLDGETIHVINNGMNESCAAQAEGWSVAPWDFLWVDRALEDKCASQLGGVFWRA